MTTSCALVATPTRRRCTGSTARRISCWFLRATSRAESVQLFGQRYGALPVVSTRRRSQGHGRRLRRGGRDRHRFRFRRAHAARAERRARPAGFPRTGRRVAEPTQARDAPRSELGSPGAPLPAGLPADARRESLSRASRTRLDGLGPPGGAPRQARLRAGRPARTRRAGGRTRPTSPAPNRRGPPRADRPRSRRRRHRAR